MISYRKLAMRVLGHSPVSAARTARRSTAKRAAALALTAALVVGMTLPAFADTWYIDDGDISISAGENGNKVTQGSTTKENDTDTVITNREPSTASSNTVTINADEGKTVNVTLDNVTINVDEGYKYGYEPNAYKTADCNNFLLFHKALRHFSAPQEECLPDDEDYQNLQFR